MIPGYYNIMTQGPKLCGKFWIDLLIENLIASNLRNSARSLNDCNVVGGYIFFQCNKILLRAQSDALFH